MSESEFAGLYDEQDFYLILILYILNQFLIFTHTYPVNFFPPEKSNLYKI
jgi:hypothetical protein